MKTAQELQDQIIAALEIAKDYGMTDGGHHKQWVIDQMIRCLTDCTWETKQATDARGREYTFMGFGESEVYREFLRLHNDGEDGPDTYQWDEGIAP